MCNYITYLNILILLYLPFPRLSSANIMVTGFEVFIFAAYIRLSLVTVCPMSPYSYFHQDTIQLLHSPAPTCRYATQFISIYPLHFLIIYLAALS